MRNDNFSWAVFSVVFASLSCFCFTSIRFTFRFELHLHFFFSASGAVGSLSTEQLFEGNLVVVHFGLDTITILFYWPQVNNQQFSKYFFYKTAATALDEAVIHL